MRGVGLNLMRLIIIMNFTLLNQTILKYRDEKLTNFINQKDLYGTDEESRVSCRGYNGTWW